MLIGASLLLSLLLGEAVECLAIPRRAVFSGGAAVLLWRVMAITWIWLVALGLTGRALFVLVATLVTLAVLVAISNAKQRYLREPLLFCDFALLEHIVRHLPLFYVPRRIWGMALLAGAALGAAILAWLLVEPGAGAAVQLGALALAAAAGGILVVWPSAVSSAGHLVFEPEPQADVGRLGLLVALIAYYVSWRLHAEARQMETNLQAPPRYDAVIVVQAESFIDLRRLGRADVRLPTFDRLKQRAISAGLIEVPCEGAYTLRPESAAISGRGFHDQGFDRFHPYLRPQRLSASALPRMLAKAGWQTLFVHPYDGAFFRRDRAMPILGFQRFADARAFVGARVVGPMSGGGCFFFKGTWGLAEGGRALFFFFPPNRKGHDPYGPGGFPGERIPFPKKFTPFENFAPCAVKAGWGHRCGFFARAVGFLRPLRPILRGLRRFFLGARDVFPGRTGRRRFVGPVLNKENTPPGSLIGSFLAFFFEDSGQH